MELVKFQDHDLEVSQISHEGVAFCHVILCPNAAEEAVAVGRGGPNVSLDEPFQFLTPTDALKVVSKTPELGIIWKVFASPFAYKQIVEALSAAKLRQ